MARIRPLHERLEFWGGVRRHNLALWDDEARIHDERIQLPSGVFTVLSVTRVLEDGGGVLRSRESSEEAGLSDVSVWLRDVNALIAPQEGVVLRIRAALGEERYLERRQFPRIPETVAEELAMEDEAFFGIGEIPITTPDPEYRNPDEVAGQFLMAALILNQGKLSKD